MNRSTQTLVLVVVLVGLAIGSAYIFRPSSQPAGGTLTVTKQPIMYEAVSLSCETTSGTTKTVTDWLHGGYTSETTVTPTTASTAHIVTTTTVTEVYLSMIGLTQSAPPKC
jgi:hypothetical protein